MPSTNAGAGGEPDVDRLFTDRMTAAFEDRIRKRGSLVFDVLPVWVRTARVGPTGKPYLIRQLAIVRDGKIEAVAYANRAGEVRWNRGFLPTEFTIEEPDHAD